MKKYTIEKARHKESIVLSKALKRASDYWGISNKQLGEFCGLSEASVSRLKNGSYLLRYNSKEWQLAVLFLRVFRGLDSYMGGSTENEIEWLKSNNKALGGVPIELMRNVEGLASVVQYIDFVRGQ